MLKDKKVIAALVVVVILLLGGGALILGKQSNSNVQTTPDAADETVGSLSPSDIGLKIEAGSDATCQVNRKDNQIKFSISKASDIKTVTGVFSYEADIPLADRVEGSNDRVVQSLEVEKEGKGSSIDSGFKLLGTCSKNICRCDTGIKSVDLVLKIVKKDSKVYEAKSSLDLEKEASE